MSYENRQRMARLDIRSNASSDRGSSSAMPSPDVVRRSTSSPTPVPSFHELDRRSAGDHHSDYDDATQRTRRDHILSRVAAMPYYENGHADSRAPVTSSHQSYAPVHRSPQHFQNHSSQGSLVILTTIMGPTTPHNSITTLTIGRRILLAQTITQAAHALPRADTEQ
ncbi:hypothetical protein BGZ91_003503 [Linnemannia elongata]|nr:hypothetical protein BGZ91_003503 [Linnemannia elongata]